MKTSKVFSALLVASLLGFTACTPRDVKVTDDATRLRIANKKGGKKTSQGPSADFSLSNYSLSAFLSEKQIEAIELVKLATGTAEANKTQFTVATQADRGDGAKQVTISSTRDVLEYASGAGAWKGKVNKNLSVTYTLKDGALEALAATGTNMRSSADSADKDKTYVNLVESTYDLSVSAIDGDAANVLVALKSAGSISGSKGGKNVPFNITIDIKMVVDKASLATSTVKIVKTTAGMTYPGAKPGSTYNSNLDGGNLTLKVDGLCNELSGQVGASAGPKNKYTVGFAGEKISVAGKNWSNDLATCGKRPTVDLGRLQVF